MSARRSPSGEAGRAPALLIAVVAALLCLRLVVGAATHLTEDEAYYRLWSFSPALGYYDHPPMIAWWIWLGRRLLGDDALGVRILPILSVAALSFLVWDLARLAGAGRATAERAGLWFNAAPLVLAGGVLAVPDAPAALFWALSLDCALRAARARPLAWWALAGLAAGLACLSKYSALFIAPGMLLWLAASRDGRTRLATPGPWLALVIAAAVFAANIAWNAQHDWLTFAKQFGRITPHRFAPRYLVELVVGQTLLIGPPTAILAAVAIWRFLKRRDAGGPDLAPFIAVAAPFAIYLVMHSLHDRVQAHWPAPLYPSIALCAALGCDGLGDGWRAWRRAAAPAGFAMGGAALAVLAAPGGWLGRADAALPVRGWTPFAARIEALRRIAGAGWVGTKSYGLAAQLADERALAAPVIEIDERDRWNDMASSWRGPLRGAGVVVDLTRRLDAQRLRGCFAQVTPLGVVVRGDPGEPGKAYAVFRVDGPRRDVLAEGCGLNSGDDARAASPPPSPAASSR